MLSEVELGKMKKAELLLQLGKVSKKTLIKIILMHHTQEGGNPFTDVCSMLRGKLTKKEINDLRDYVMKYSEEIPNFMNKDYHDPIQVKSLVELFPKQKDLIMRNKESDNSSINNIVNNYQTSLSFTYTRPQVHYNSYALIKQTINSLQHRVAYAYLQFCEYMRVLISKSNSSDICKEEVESLKKYTDHWVSIIAVDLDILAKLIPQPKADADLPKGGKHTKKH
jgi:hypothetical protein